MLTSLPIKFDNGAYLINNCHYADDTILFLKAKHSVVESAWWAMQAFEAVSEIRINLDKSEMYGINTNQLGSLANTFRCKTASFPIKYLGLPLHDRKLRVSDWRFLIDKVDKKTPKLDRTITFNWGENYTYQFSFNGSSFICPFPL